MLGLLYPLPHAATLQPDTMLYPAPASSEWQHQSWAAPSPAQCPPGSSREEQRAALDVNTQLAAAEHTREPDPKHQHLQAEGKRGQLGMEPLGAGLGPLAAGEDSRGSRGTAWQLGAENPAADPAKRPWSPRSGGRSCAAPQEKYGQHRAQLLLALLPGDKPLGASSSSRGQRQPSQSSSRGRLAQGRAVAGRSEPRLGSHHQPQPRSAARPHPVSC